MQSISEQLLKSCDELSIETVLNVEREWNDKKGFLMSLTNHKICDEISQSLIRLKSYTNKNYGFCDEAYAEFDILKALIKDVADDEKIKYFNVF